MAVSSPAVTRRRAASSEWRKEGLCRGLDPAAFLPLPADDTSLAKAVCGACPVRRDCLYHALERREHQGIWGGYEEAERRGFVRRLFGSDPMPLVDELVTPPSEDARAAGAAAVDILRRQAADKLRGRRMSPPVTTLPATTPLRPARSPAAHLPPAAEAAGPAPAPLGRQESRPHQAEAIRAVLASIGDGGRCQVVMACGTGKTLVGERAAELLVGGGLVLVCVPSLSLVDQTWRSWAANAAQPFSSLAVCSDDDLTSEDVVDGVESIVASTGMTVTTDPFEIARFVVDRGAGKTRVVFTTYHSTPRVAEAFALDDEAKSLLGLPAAIPAFDLVVADEAHRTAGRLDSPFATVLDPEAIPAARHLFLTATPRNCVHRDEMASMDEPAYYGEVAFELDFGEAIEQGLLTDYQIVVVAVRDAAALSALKKGARIELADGEEADPGHVAVAAALAEAAREYDLHSILAFHDRVAKSKRFTEELEAVVARLRPGRRPDQRLGASHIDGTVPGHTRRGLLDALDDPSGQSWHVLSSVRTIAEGVDVPAIDCVAFVDPRRSAVDIVQAVGRALRPNPRRTAPSVVLLPVYVPDDGDEVIDLAEFLQLWQVIDALRRHDDSLEAAYRRLNVPAAPTGHPAKSSAPETVELADGRIVLPKRLVPFFLDAFRTRLITRQVRAFERGLRALDAYIERFGDPDVPQRYVDPDGFALGGWTSQRRRDYQAGRLSPDQVLEFEDRGFIWDGFDAKFRRGIQAIRDFRQVNPEAELTSSSVAPDGFAVGKWAHLWCSRYSRGDVAPGRAQALRVHGVPLDLFSPEWGPGLAELDAFLAGVGRRRRIPANAKTASGFRLGLWYRRQYSRYLRGELTAAEFEALDGRGVLHADPATDGWNRGFSALATWSAREGGATPPFHARVGDQRPGVWLLRRFYDHRRRALSPAQLAALAGLGVDWARGVASAAEAAA